MIMLNLRGGIITNRPEYLTSFSLGKFKNGKIGDFFSDNSSMGLRGFPAGKVYADKTAAATIEYRLPVIQADAGIKTFPALFRDTWLSLFFDYGNVWDSNPKIKDSTVFIRRIRRQQCDNHTQRWSWRS